jgi:hypothetical protein
MPCAAPGSFDDRAFGVDTGGMRVWEQGRAVVDYLIAQGLLRVVPASPKDADAMLASAQHRARLVKDVERTDPDAAFAGAYAAVREAFTGVLLVQGLRPVVGEDHVAIASALMAQLHPPLGRVLKRFDWMYRTLNTPDRPHVTEAQLRNAGQILEQVLPLTEQLIEIIPPYRPLTGHRPLSPAPETSRVLGTATYGPRQHHLG